MKKICISTYLFLSSIVLFAQPVLTQSNSFNVGDHIRYFVQFEPLINEGDGGTDQLWDFSSLTTVNPPQDFTAVMTDSTPYGDYFPEANVAAGFVDYMGNDSYSFLLNSATEFAFWGFASELMIDVNTDPRDILRYPFSYGDNFSDNYFAPNGIGFNSGLVSVSGDGYGDLIIPGSIDTFHNCLRVREVRMDTVEGEIMLQTSMDTSYKYYSEEYSEPLCMVVHHHTAEGAIFNEIYWQDLSISRIEHVQHQDINIYPNPCFDVLHAEFTAGEKIVSVVVTDLPGAEINIPWIYNEGGLELQTINLPVGMYFISIQTENTWFTGEFLK